MQHIYKKIVKEGNGYHDYLRCTYIRYNNFEVLCAAIKMYEVDLECAETVKARPTGNDSCFITYSNTLYFSGILLHNIDYLIIQWENNVKNRLHHGSKISITNIVLKYGVISAKYYLLTVQETQVSHIVNKTKISL